MWHSSSDNDEGFFLFVCLLTISLSTFYNIYLFALLIYLVTKSKRGCLVYEMNGIFLHNFMYYHCDILQLRNL